MENLSKLINISEERKIEIIKKLEKKRSNSSIIIAENLSWIEFKQVLVNLSSLPGIIEVDLKDLHERVFISSFGYVE